MIITSDHLPIFTITGHELHKYPKKTKPDDYTARKITNKSLEFFSSKLQSCDWQSMLSKNDPTESYPAFLKEFFELYNKSFPIKKYQAKNTTRTNNPWISSGLKKSSNMQTSSLTYTPYS